VKPQRRKNAKRVKPQRQNEKGHLLPLEEVKARLQLIMPRVEAGTASDEERKKLR
jgi:hypothetical protein